MSKSSGKRVYSSSGFVSDRSARLVSISICCKRDRRVLIVLRLFFLIELNSVVSSVLLYKIEIRSIEKVVWSSEIFIS